MKTVYEIMEISHPYNEQCALVSSYKKALDYVLANIGTARAVKVNDVWTHDDPPKQYKGETKLFGRVCGGYCYDGFIIKQHKVI